MAQLVSKERTRNTKKRHKKAGLNTTQRVALLDRPFVGLIVATVLWLTAIFGWRAKSLFQHDLTMEFFLPFVSDAVFALVGLFCVALFLNVVAPEHLRRNSRIVLLSITSLLASGVAAVLQYTATTLPLIPEYSARFILPYALAPILSTILIGGRAGLAAGTWTSLVIALNWDRSLAIFITGLVATAVASHSARAVRTRTKVVKLGLVIGLSQIICVLGVTALDWNRPDVMQVVHQAAASIVGGLLSAIVALLNMYSPLPPTSPCLSSRTWGIPSSSVWRLRPPALTTIVSLLRTLPRQLRRLSTLTPSKPECAPIFTT